MPEAAEWIRMDTPYVSRSSAAMLGVYRCPSGLAELLDARVRLRLAQVGDGREDRALGNLKAVAGPGLRRACLMKV